MDCLQRLNLNFAVLQKVKLDGTVTVMQKVFKDHYV